MLLYNQTRSLSNCKTMILCEKDEIFLLKICIVLFLFVVCCTILCDNDTKYYFIALFIIFNIVGL